MLLMIPPAVAPVAVLAVLLTSGKAPCAGTNVWYDVPVV